MFLIVGLNFANKPSKMIFFLVGIAKSAQKNNKIERHAINSKDLFVS